MLTPAEVDPDAPYDEDDDLDDAMPRVQFSRRNAAVFIFCVASAIAFLYVVLPNIHGLDDTWHKVGNGKPAWLVVAFLFTAASFVGYVLLFHGVFVKAADNIDFRASYQITMAGLAATRLFAAGGAGGVALTAWALRRSGMSRRMVADKTLAFLALTYVVYALALVVMPLGMYVGLFPGRATFALTAPPVIFGLVCFVLAGLLMRVPTDLQRRLDRRASSEGRTAKIAQRLAHAPAASSAGLREAVTHARSRDPALIGSIIYWAANVGILWACFKAFGHSPSWSVLVMAYFVGYMGNLLPLPAGVGGLDGGMIGMLAALQVPIEDATVAVLAYRVFAIELPTIPGALAYFQLRRTVARWDGERRAERAERVRRAAAAEA